jgi:putative acetyltransferase
MAEIIFTYQGYTCRPWQASDRDVCVQLVRGVLAEYALVFQPDTEGDLLTVETVYGEGCFWVVENADGQVVGTGGYHPDQRGVNAIEIRKMYLHRSARGIGLGQRLLQALEDHAFNKGYRLVWLETDKRLPQAIKLYEKQGYQITSPCLSNHGCDQVFYKDLCTN